MTRRQQLWALIVCSALTAALQYIIQGAFATGGDPATFSDLFWFFDRALWGIRALIESWVIIYLFTTSVGGRGFIHRLFLEAILLMLEIGLLALIIFTLGPAFQALGAKTTVYDLMGMGRYAGWSYGIAAYTALMMAGAGIAYKIQPLDIGPIKKRKKKVKASVTREEALPTVIEAIKENDGKISQRELAPQIGVAPGTLGNWLKLWQDEMVIGKLPGRGRFQVIEEEGMEIPEFGD